MPDFGFNFGRRHLLASSEGVFAITPGTAKIARRQPHENAGKTRKRGLALNGTVNFDDLHLLGISSGGCVRLPDGHILHPDSPVGHRLEPRARLIIEISCDILRRWV